MLYLREPWSAERKARMADFHRKRWGAPDGHCTIYGHHVPLEHAEPVRFWAQWIAAQEGKESASEFVRQHKASDFSGVGRLRELWEARKAIAKSRELVRDLEWEALHGRH